MKTEKKGFHEFKKTRIAPIAIRTIKNEFNELKRMSRIPRITRANVTYAITGVCNSPPWRAGPDSG
jgi:hypothetical protein